MLLPVSLFLSCHLPLSFFCCVYPSLSLSLSVHRRLLLFAQVKNVLSDGDGHRIAFDWRGANALRPCLKHVNVVSKRSGVGGNDGYEDITCRDWRKMRTAGPHFLADAMELVIQAEKEYEEGRMTQGRFMAICQSSGLWAAPLGLLADRALRLHIRWSDVITMDWMHTMLQDGVLHVEFWLFFRKLLERGDCDNNTLMNFFKNGWGFPSHTRTAIDKPFL